MSGDIQNIENNDETLRKYFAQIPNMLYDDPNLKSVDRDIYSILKKIAGDSGECYMRLDNLTKYIKVSRPTYLKSRRKLEALEYITIKEKKLENRPDSWPSVHIKIIDIWDKNIEYCILKKQLKNFTGLENENLVKKLNQFFKESVKIINRIKVKPVKIRSSKNNTININKTTGHEEKHLSPKKQDSDISTNIDIQVINQTSDSITYQSAIDIYKQSYEQFTGKKYLFIKGKDSNGAKNVMELFNAMPEMYKVFLDRYFSGDKRVYKPEYYSISNFVYHFNSLNLKEDKKSGLSFNDIFGDTLKEMAMEESNAR